MAVALYSWLLKHVIKEGNCHSFVSSVNGRAGLFHSGAAAERGGGGLMPRAASQWALTKGSDRWKVVDSLRVTPAPKLGGWAGKRLRLLSVSRGQSVLTDLEHGSLAVKQRRTVIPSIQRMWFHAQGAAMGYTNPRGSQAAELY